MEDAWSTILTVNIQYIQYIYSIYTAEDLRNYIGKYFYEFEHESKLWNEFETNLERSRPTQVMYHLPRVQYSIHLIPNLSGQHFSVMRKRAPEHCASGILHFNLLPPERHTSNCITVGSVVSIRRQRAASAAALTVTWSGDWYRSHTCQCSAWQVSLSWSKKWEVNYARLAHIALTVRCAYLHLVVMTRIKSSFL